MTHEPAEHDERTDDDFAKGEEELPDADPEKHVKRDFAEGQESTPPD